MALPTHSPSTEAQVRDLIAGAAVRGHTLEIRGGGSKRALRRHAPAGAVLDMSGILGITDYDPDELVMTARAGTRLADIESVLEERRQMLAFEPFDHAALLGDAPGSATLGGIIAANVSGPRRLSAGAARDHILGFSAVSGKGELLKGGGAVVKNVTGFDLPKLMAGSWGTLAALTSLTVRVLPRPRTEKTVMFAGLTDELANRLMTTAVSSAAAVSCAAHLPAEAAVTALRVEGFGPSVDARCRALAHSLVDFGTPFMLDAERSAALWREVRTLVALPVQGHVLWRVSVPPACGWQVRARLASRGAQFIFDWGGALVWVAIPEHAAMEHAARVTAVARELGGHAMLVRAPIAHRALPAELDAAWGARAEGAEGAGGALRRLRARVKAAFDPLGVLNPGLDPATDA